MPNTDLGDAVETDGKKQSRNFKNTLINGFNQKKIWKRSNSSGVKFSKNTRSEVGPMDTTKTTTDEESSAVNQGHTLAIMETISCSLDPNLELELKSASEDANAMRKAIEVKSQHLKQVKPVA